MSSAVTFKLLSVRNLFFNSGSPALKNSSYSPLPPQQQQQQQHAALADKNGSTSGAAANSNDNDTIMATVTSSNSTSTGNDNSNGRFHFAILVTGVYIFFGIHNYLQEAIMNIDGFQHHTVMLGYFEVVGVAVCTYIERKFTASGSKTGASSTSTTAAPWTAYPLLTLCLVSSSGLSNMSLNYINFPTKVVFRSCKLIPTMVIATALNKSTRFSGVEYFCAMAACIGLILFAAADWELSPSFHPIGLVLVSASVVADAILPNAQQKLFQHPYNASRTEVTLYTNIYTLAIMTVSTSLSGDLPAIVQLLFWGNTNNDSMMAGANSIGTNTTDISNRSLSEQDQQHHTLRLYLLVYTFVAYLAISCHMNIVKQYGGVAAVVVATGRKACTLMLSFILFPKSFSYLYVFGAILVLSSILISSIYKIQQKQKAKKTAIAAAATNDDEEVPTNKLLQQPTVEDISSGSSPTNSNEDTNHRRLSPPTHRTKSARGYY